MKKSKADKAAEFVMKCAQSLISVSKLLINSHRSEVSDSLREGNKIIIMGNGPSLRDTIDRHSIVMKSTPLMAVNFAANADTFFELRPKYYVMADPAFFSDPAQNAVFTRLYENFNRVDWDMVLFVPFESYGVRNNIKNHNIKIVRFNFIGVDGFKFLSRKALKSKRGMPRPRNVLIPCLMIALWMGYKEIYLTGADHSWMKTLTVDETNKIIFIQPHFYKENRDEKEKQRIASVYEDVKLHDILESFHVAFKSYFEIERYAKETGAAIYNATPGSFIDAFTRKGLE